MSSGLLEKLPKAKIWDKPILPFNYAVVLVVVFVIYKKMQYCHAKMHHLSSMIHMLDT